LVLDGATQTMATAGETLGTGISEDDCGGEQAEGGTRATFATSTGRTHHGKDCLNDGGSRS